MQYSYIMIHEHIMQINIKGSDITKERIKGMCCQIIHHIFIDYLPLLTWLLFLTIKAIVLLPKKQSQRKNYAGEWHILGIGCNRAFILSNIDYNIFFQKIKIL